MVMYVHHAKSSVFQNFPDASRAQGRLSQRGTSSTKLARLAELPHFGKKNWYYSKHHSSLSNSRFPRRYLDNSHSWCSNDGNSWTIAVSFRNWQPTNREPDVECSWRPARSGFPCTVVGTRTIYVWLSSSTLFPFIRTVRDSKMRISADRWVIRDMWAGNIINIFFEGRQGSKVQSGSVWIYEILRPFMW